MPLESQEQFGFKTQQRVEVRGRWSGPPRGFYVMIEGMPEEKKTPSRIKLELFAYNDKGEEVSEGLLEIRPEAGGGDGSIRYRFATTDEDAVKALVDNAAGYLAGTIRNMPPGTLNAAEDGQPGEYVAVRIPAGEGVEYVKDELPYGQHMVMLNTEIERDPEGRIKRLGGEMNLFQKVKPVNPDTGPSYKIMVKGGWREIRDIDEYVDKHKLVVYKLNVDR